MQAYLAAVAHHMAGGRMQISQNWIGQVWSLIGIASAVETPVNPMTLTICVATVAEVSPAALADFPRQVDGFARSLRRQSVFGVKGGTMAVAALVSERVHPGVLKKLTNKPMSFGSIVVPAVVDLGAGQLHIAANTPFFGMAMWGAVRAQARNYLPEPRLVLG
ncbi:hypothetical protein [Nocardia sp. NBC_00403]|uniref:hypothetical protein n=1 Tax=Nocardia sp. NBC_00403 TaxID=2975990 RepID=UPI002E24272F